MCVCNNSKAIAWNGLESCFFISSNKFSHFRKVSQLSIPKYSRSGRLWSKFRQRQRAPIVFRRFQKSESPRNLYAIFKFYLHFAQFCYAEIIPKSARNLSFRWLSSKWIMFYSFAKIIILQFKTRKKRTVLWRFEEKKRRKQQYNERKMNWIIKKPNEE